MKAKLIEHVAPGAKLEQELVCRAKSAAFVPVTVTFETFTAAVVDTFVRVMDWVGLVVPTAWLEKGRLVGVIATAVPVPVRLIGCGPPLALLFMFTIAQRVPGAVGEKVTPTLHEVPGATLEQVEVTWKSPALAPLRFTPETLMDAAPPPLLLRKNRLTVLVVPTA